MYSGTIVDHKNLPNELIEHILASEYKWTLDEIKKLPPQKFQAHIGICLVKRRLEVTRAEKAAIVTASRGMMPMPNIT